MKKLNKKIKNYFKRNDCFADVVNFAIYGGENVITDQSLQNVDMIGDANFNTENAICLRELLEYVSFVVEKRTNDYFFAIIGVTAKSTQVIPIIRMLYDVCIEEWQIINNGYEVEDLDEAMKDKVLFQGIPIFINVDSKSLK